MTYGNCAGNFFGCPIYEPGHNYYTFQRCRLWTFQSNGNRCLNMQIAVKLIPSDESVCLSVCPSVRPSVCLSACCSVCPPVRLSVCLSVCLLSVCLSSKRLSVCPIVYCLLSVWQYTQASVRPKRIALKICAEHGSDTVVLCANFQDDWQLKRMLRTNEISRDLSLKWASVGHPILHNPMRWEMVVYISNYFRFSVGLGQLTFKYG